MQQVDIDLGQTCFVCFKVWKKYSSELIDLSRSEKRLDAIHCLNELITNALRHIPDVIEYLSRVENQSVFNFCAIPQVSKLLIYICDIVLNPIKRHHTIDTPHTKLHISTHGWITAWLMAIFPL